MIDGLLLTQLKTIDVPGGDVLHAMKSSDPGYVGFGEAYFSLVESRAVKAWKRHREMTLNLVVPTGAVRFVLYDDRPSSSTYLQYNEILVSRENYIRITLPPMIWLGFQGISQSTSAVLNIADIHHNPAETDKVDTNTISYCWDFE